MQQAHCQPLSNSNHGSPLKNPAFILSAIMLGKAGVINASVGVVIITAWANSFLSAFPNEKSSRAHFSTYYIPHQVYTIGHQLFYNDSSELHACYSLLSKGTTHLGQTGLHSHSKSFDVQSTNTHSQRTASLH